MTSSSLPDLELSQRSPITGLSCHRRSSRGLWRLPLALREHPEEYGLVLRLGTSRVGTDSAFLRFLRHSQPSGLTGAGTRGCRQRRGKVWAHKKVYDLCGLEGWPVSDLSKSHVLCAGLCVRTRGGDAVLRDLLSASFSVFAGSCCLSA